jgi:hypothetical protein
MPWPFRFCNEYRVRMRIIIGLGLSASRPLLCQQATSKHSDMVVPMLPDLSPGPDEAVTFPVHYGLSDAPNKCCGTVGCEVRLCLLFPAILQIPGPDPRGSHMPSSHVSAVHLEEV